jgi:hypothetical protein
MTFLPLRIDTVVGFRIVFKQIKLTSRLLKNSGCRLLKKIQRRGARKIDELRRTYSTLQRRDLSATKHMGFFSSLPVPRRTFHDVEQINLGTSARRVP